jgi:hypothetical protein
MDQTAGNDSTNVLSILLNASAFSSITMCPEFSINDNCAPGIASRKNCEYSGGVILSSAPQIIKVGIPICGI